MAVWGRIGRYSCIMRNTCKSRPHAYGHSRPQTAALAPPPRIACIVYAPHSPPAASSRLRVDLPSAATCVASLGVERGATAAIAVRPEVGWQARGLDGRAAHLHPRRKGASDTPRGSRPKVWRPRGRETHTSLLASIQRMPASSVRAAPAVECHCWLRGRWHVARRTSGAFPRRSHH